MRDSAWGAAAIGARGAAFHLNVGADLEGLGAVLSQENDRCVVAYVSHVLAKQERQYCDTRREMLALVWATQLPLGEPSQSSHRPQ